MFSWLWKNKVESKQVIIGIRELQLINDILFPEYELEQIPGGEYYHIDRSVDTNLDGVIFDLEDGKNDETSRQTLKHISDKLFKVRELLQVHQEMHPDVKHIVFSQEEKDEN